MTDLEMTKLCAEAMGFEYTDFHFPTVILTGDNSGEDYDPLHDDAQAVSLVKKFRIDINGGIKGGEIIDDWMVICIVCIGEYTKLFQSASGDLNRAIVECIAKMQSTRKGD